MGCGAGARSRARSTGTTRPAAPWILVVSRAASPSRSGRRACAMRPYWGASGSSARRSPSLMRHVPRVASLHGNRPGRQRLAVLVAGGHGDELVEFRRHEPPEDESGAPRVVEGGLAGCDDAVAVVEVVLRDVFGRMAVVCGGATRLAVRAIGTPAGAGRAGYGGRPWGSPGGASRRSTPSRRRPPRRRRRSLPRRRIR